MKRRMLLKRVWRKQSQLLFVLVSYSQCLRQVRFKGNIEKISISANKTVDAIDSGLKATGDAAANLLGKMTPSNNQSYDLVKNE